MLGARVFSPMVTSVATIAPAVLAAKMTTRRRTPPPFGYGPDAMLEEPPNAALAPTYRRERTHQVEDQ